MPALLPVRLGREKRHSLAALSVNSAPQLRWWPGAEIGSVHRAARGEL